MTIDTWAYPGARWWKFDFHTHTPASHDTPWYRKSLNLAPREWLLKYMVAGVHCVAVTDHNSGAWVDELKKAYADLELENDWNDVSGFRKLAVFPGVEISVNGGIHILAIFDTSATS
ncbi:MAG: chromosome segregation protein SMC, partial [Zoogloeaceae bacterium]|nr:chromosome segregation protein SMC [Zoogloeaceae bacterium]